MANIVPNCVEGCQDPDPSPSSPGYYLGTNGLPVNCIGTDYSPDADMDDLGDACETLLASTFAPLLTYESTNDYLAREPHWAARWVTTGSTARIIYLLSYYRDLGNSNSLCATFQIG